MKLTSREMLIFVLVALAVMLGGLLLIGLLWGFGGMIGPGMMGPGMMGGMGLFWLLLLCLLLLPLLLILAVAIWLVVSKDESRSPQQAMSCPQCGRAVQPDWRVCPNCGKQLKGESGQ
jgi:hypothetical protein